MIVVEAPGWRGATKAHTAVSSLITGLEQFSREAKTFGHRHELLETSEDRLPAGLAVPLDVTTERRNREKDFAIGWLVGQLDAPLLSEDEQMVGVEDDLC